MGVHYGLKSFVSTSGLILNLDATNSLSYPGTGNIWYDLSNTIGNVNVQNRSTDWSFVTDSEINIKCLYNNNNRTSGNSPGIDIPMNNGFNKSAGTIEMWLKPTSMTGGHGWFNNSDGSSFTNVSGWLWFGTWENSTLIYSRFSSPSSCCHDLAAANWLDTYILNKWIHISLTWNLSSTSSAIYVNGNQFLSRTNLPTDIPSSNPTNTGQLFNGHTRGDNMQFKGYCSMYRIYNRALSATEVKRNFAATAGVHKL